MSAIEDAGKSCLEHWRGSRIVKEDVSIFNAPARSNAFHPEVQFCTKVIGYEIEWFTNKQNLLAINPGDGVIAAGRREETNSLKC